MPLRVDMPEMILSNRIGASFNHLFIIINKMEQDAEDDVIWDFSSTKALNSFFLLPLALYRYRCGKRVVCQNIPDNLASYFDTIHFPDMLDAENVDDFHVYMERFSTKSYIPMIKFPALQSKDEIKNKIMSIVGKILRKQLSLTINIYSGISYLLSEIIDNITEHSRSMYGYIFAQYYNKKYIDICIADEGITVLGSFVRNGNTDIHDDLEALQNASVGVSTKNRPEAENRGYGIVTTKRMLTEGLRGEFFLFSGGAFYRKTFLEENYVALPKNIKWDGTIALLRIPCINNIEFDYTNYLEA